MKAKNTVITVLMAALIAAFVVGCQTPIENADSGSEGKDSLVSPDKTIVRLNLINPNSDSRTVFPGGTLPSDLSDFSSFTLLVYNVTDSASFPLTGTNSTYGATFTASDFTGAGNVISLSLTSAKSYKFTLNAYNHATPTSGKKVAIAETTTGVLNASTGVSLTLKENVDGSDTGTFVWNVTDTTFTDPVTGGAIEYDTAVLTLTNLATSATIVKDLLADEDTDGTIDGNTGSDATIPSGIYRMTIPLTKTNYQTVIVQDIVHIYAGYTSTYSATLPALRSTRHAITFHYNDGLKPNANINVTHGDTISSSYFTVTNTTSPSTLTFAGWYTDDVSFNNQVTSTTPILKPLGLYAKWNATPAITATITVGVSFTQNLPLVVSGSVTSINNASLVISLTVSGATGYDLTWKDEQGDPLTVTGSGPYTLTIPFAGNVNWWQAGDHDITLEAQSTTNPSKWFSDVVTITINTP